MSFAQIFPKIPKTYFTFLSQIVTLPRLDKVDFGFGRIFIVITAKC